MLYHLVFITNKGKTIRVMLMNFQLFPGHFHPRRHGIKVKDK